LYGGYSWFLRAGAKGKQKQQNQRAQYTRHGGLLKTLSADEMPKAFSSLSHAAHSGKRRAAAVRRKSTFFLCR
jgi:hypothetical protein